MTTGISDPAPTDYRQRHPIAIKEGDRTVELFIGHARGGLSPAQRADVGAFAHAWRRESTGGIIVDVPAGTPNAYAAQRCDARSSFDPGALRGAGVRGSRSRPYQPADPRIMANLKLNYPRMVASAGPCGLWPDDIGPSANRNYNENDQYYNFGCATSATSPPWWRTRPIWCSRAARRRSTRARRSVVLDKYRKGEATAATNPEAEKGKISDVGK